MFVWFATGHHDDDHIFCAHDMREHALCIWADLADCYGELLLVSLTPDYNIQYIHAAPYGYTVVTEQKKKP